MNVLLGVTGSVAAKLTPKIQKSIVDAGHELKTVATSSALHFRENWYEWKPYFVDSDEWEFYKIYNEVLHIDLVKWADIFIIAPYTANSLSKISNGICDNLLTSCARAWDYRKKMIIAPAMNTQMYVNPLTQIQKDILFDFGAIFVDPQVKELFCGDTGIGAMADIDDIIKRI